MDEQSYVEGVRNIFGKKKNVVIGQVETMGPYEVHLICMLRLTKQSFRYFIDLFNFVFFFSK